MTTVTRFEPDRLAALAPELIAWGARHGRSYPWRNESGYRLAVAEVLLQKTRGDAVVSVWRKVCSAYPDAGRLARARRSRLEGIVAPLGLGKQRTERLRKMALGLVRGDEPPPGLGPYGHAIVAMAEGAKPQEPPVDGNIARVVTRFFGLEFTRGEPRKKREVKSAVDALLKAAPGQTRDATYALVDLGAVVCLSRSPTCPRCPLSASCAAPR